MTWRQFYKLNPDKTTSPVDMNGYADFLLSEFGIAHKRVALTEMAPRVAVSTVFLGINHSVGSGPPILFETMVFENGEEINMRRYATWQEAVAGHHKIVAETIANLNSQC